MKKKILALNYVPVGSVRAQRLYYITINNVHSQREAKSVKQQRQQTGQAVETGVGAMKDLWGPRHTLEIPPVTLAPTMT